VPEPTDRDTALTETAEAMFGAFTVVPRDLRPVPAAVRDITLGQMRLLFLLQREGPQPMGRIAEVFDLSSTASTGFVSRIERHGLVERRHRSDDRRVVECALTEAGGRFLHGISGVRLDLIRQRLAALEPDELSEFGRLLRLISERGGKPA
jgi:DNA-binding MarR family transcriptional regulator